MEIIQTNKLKHNYEYSLYPFEKKMSVSICEGLNIQW